MGSSQHTNLSSAADAARHVQSESSLRVDCQSAEQSIVLLARMYAALSATNDAILRTKSPEELYQRVCDAAVHGGKFISAAAILADPGAGDMRVVATSGVGAQQLRDAAVSIDATLPRGRGMVGHAFREQKPSISNDFLNDERTRPWHHVARSVGAAAAAALPLIKGDVAVGVLFFYSGDKGAFDDEIVKLLQRMAENVSSALDNFEKEADRIKVEQSIVQLGQMYAALSATNEAILRANSPAELFQLVCEAAVRYSKFLATAVLLVEPDAIWVRVAAMAGPAERQLSLPKISIDETLPEGQGLVGTAFRTNKPCISNDYLNDHRLQSWHAKTQKAGVAAAACLPLLTAGCPIGVLYFCSCEKGIFNAEIVNLLERIAENVSFALDNFEHETQRRRGEQALRESEEKYRVILASIEEAYYEVDLVGNLVLFNAAFCKLLGYSEHELTGMNNRQYQTPEVAASTFKVFNRVYRTGIARRSFDWELVRKDGNKVLGEGSVYLIRDVQGQAIGFRGMLRDVTARRQTEQALRESETRFRATFAQAAVGIAHVARSGRFLVANDKLCDILKYPRAELLQKTVKDISHPEDRDLTDEMRARLQAGEIATFSAEKRYLRRDGSDVWVRLTVSLARNAAGEPDYEITVVEDITARKEAEERIQYLAHHDGLTNLPNRTMFSEMLNMAIQQARRYKRGFAVLFIDLDRFKNINDTLGHEAGDKLLQAMGARLAETVRSSDIVARLGGDEFVVLVQEVSESQYASTVARKILSALIKPVTIGGQECRVTASIGICMYPGDAQDEQSLMRNADLAMYHAKEEGKNNFQFYSKEIKSQSIERMALETSLRRALEREEFFLHYQAKLDLKTRQINGVEALVRWQHPDLGLVSPAQFIPLAEETGLIVPLGKWVLRTACAQNVAWQRDGLPPICMAVNLSMRQFADDSLLRDVAAALEDSGMKPELLELELTESMVMHNADRAGKVLAAIKQMGVRLAIDDFGVGYSSLAQIKRFPIDTLKVDRSFIRNLPQNPEDRAITEAIIAMGRTLSLTVVAEGVETVEQETFLRDHACDESQGFYFSKPIAADQFADLLRDHVAAPSSKRVG